jgi:hypothetical protein
MCAALGEMSVTATTEVVELVCVGEVGRERDAARSESDGSGDSRVSDESESDEMSIGMVVRRAVLSGLWFGVGRERRVGFLFVWVVNCPLWFLRLFGVGLSDLESDGTGDLDFLWLFRCALIHRRFLGGLWVCGELSVLVLFRGNGILWDFSLRKFSLNSDLIILTNEYSGDR